jgi:phosphatidylserine/phosphatidylglycerophosphate/cardiolipin synthase-like enzyme
VGLASKAGAWAAVGSANLTGRGMTENVELLTLAEGPATDLYFVSLLEWLRKQHALGFPPTDTIMVSIRAMFEAKPIANQAHKNAAKQLDEVFARAASVRLRRSMIAYVRETRLYTSHKLAIHAVLLHARMAA